MLMVYGLVERKCTYFKIIIRNPGDICTILLSLYPFQSQLHCSVKMSTLRALLTPRSAISWCPAQYYNYSKRGVAMPGASKILALPERGVGVDLTHAKIFWWI